MRITIMAEHDPPAAKVDVSGRPVRRRKGRRGKSGPAIAGKGKGKPRPQGGVPSSEVGAMPRVENQTQPTVAAKAGGKIARKRGRRRKTGKGTLQNRPHDTRVSENHAAENRAVENRGPEHRGADNTSQDHRQSENRAGTFSPTPKRHDARAHEHGAAASHQARHNAAMDPRAYVRETTFIPPSFTSARQSYAALDLGTNNCRLLIARPSGENFTVIDAFSRVVRLGEGLAQSGRLSEAAMDRTLSALRVCADKLMRRNVLLARSVATEACRRAVNGPEFIERVREETGIALDIISAHEEARLAVLGCHVLLEDGIGPAMIFDIGGGSTELVLIESTGTVPRILDWQSVPWGVVSLTESCGPEGTTHEERVARYRQMYDLVAQSFAPFSERVSSARESAVQGGPLRLLGTSGTVTTLASLHLELPQYDRRMVDGLIVPAEAMRGISTRLSVMPVHERIRLACIGRERADLVVAGCAILEAILDLWPAARLGVADRGIREGILRSLIASHTRGVRRMPDIDADNDVVRNAIGAR